MVLSTAKKGSPAENAMASWLVFNFPVSSNPGRIFPASETDRSPESIDQRLSLGSVWITHNH